MTSSSPLKSILKTSIPAVVDLSSQTIMWTIEAILVGKISAAAFGGVAMAIQIVIVFLSIPLTFVVGSSVIINHHLGKNERWEANHILGQAMMIGVVMALIFAITWYSGGIHLFKLISKAGAEEAGFAAEQAGVTYLRTIAYFAPLIITNFIGVGIIRASGDTHFSMIINMTINLLNLVLAPLLIFGWFGFPRMEVQGAALAVGISHSVGLLMTGLILRSRKTVLFLSFRELTTPNFRSFKRLFKTGFPTTVEQLTVAVGMLFVMSYAARLGWATLTAQAVFVRIQGVLSMAYMGFSLGAMTLMGQNLGAAQHHKAMRTAAISGRVVLVFSISLSLCMAIFYKQIMSLFLTGADTVVFETARFAFYVFAFAQIPKAFLSTITGNLRGAGDLRFIMWITLISTLFFEVWLNYVGAFVFGFGLIGIWGVHALGESTRVCINSWRLHGGKWKFIDNI